MIGGGGGAVLVPDQPTQVFQRRTIAHQRPDQNNFRVDLSAIVQPELFFFFCFLSKETRYKQVERRKRIDNRLYLSFVTTLRPFGNVMVDQVEDGPKARQVVGHSRVAGVQPESSTRIVDAHARRPFVRL